MKGISSVEWSEQKETLNGINGMLASLRMFGMECSLE
jgi:hypothetical protein